MKLAIMQPYLFPYLGYFQLLHAVDQFVVYDDVNYITRGWINRNRVLENGAAKLITLNTRGASQNVHINQVGVGDNGEKLLKTILHCYRKAPHFATTFPVVEQAMTSGDGNLAAFLASSLQVLASYLGLAPRWLVSSEISQDRTLRGEDRIIHLCQVLAATEYINLPGGRALYEQDRFARHDIKLSFIATKTGEYAQFDAAFVPNLSIIDVLMFNSVERCREMVADYTLE